MDFKVLGRSVLGAALHCIAILCLGVAHAGAQTINNRFDHAMECKRENSSRLDGELLCNERRPAETVVIEHETQLTTRIEGHAFQTRQCRAEVSFGYAQNNTFASVDGELENSTCGASSGNIVFAVRTTSDSGEQEVQEFTQPWAREDDQTITFSAEFPIGENVELGRVRVVRTQCTCAELPQAQPGP